MSIASFFIVIALLVIVLKILTFPFKVIIKFTINSIIGGILLAICAALGIIVQVYWWTILLTGLFGIPGFAISCLITFFI